MKNIKDDEKLNVLNHSCAHLLAHAIKHLYPNAKFWVGPVIESGFYYDIDLGDITLTEEDLPNIEREMKKISKSDKLIKRIELSKEEALDMFKDDEYKVDLISRMDENDTVISAYKQDDFIDLCRGPHMNTTKDMKYFKLLKVSGAYWKGDASNKMLQRIYGICFETENDLNEYLEYLEEAKSRDHRKIGKDMKIYMLSDLVGKGLPMWLPNGYTLWRILQNYITDKEVYNGYLHVHTPDLGSVDLYKTSGHWDHYKDDMFPSMKLDNEEYVLRPMNCPHHMVIYGNELHSYKDLPIRIAEIANDFRFEAQGAVKGIERTRAFTQNDSHIFCTPSQVESEFKAVVDLILDVYKDFKIDTSKCDFRLSLRDKESKTNKYFDDDEMWDNAENALRQVLNDLKIDYFEAKDEAAFYGPKLDILVHPAIGNPVALSTVQLDFLLPRRFDLNFINDKGEKETPVVIHRAILGSLDRFIAFLLEETKGNLPLWLAPRQINIIPVNNEYHLDYSKELKQLLKDNNFRVDLDDREEKLSYKMRESVISKVPYTLIIGDKERDSKTISYRLRGNNETFNINIDEFIEKLNDEIISKKI